MALWVHKMYSFTGHICYWRYVDNPQSQFTFPKDFKIIYSHQILSMVVLSWLLQRMQVTRHVATPSQLSTMPFRHVSLKKQNGSFGMLNVSWGSTWPNKKTMHCIPQAAFLLVAHLNHTLVEWMVSFGTWNPQRREMVMILMPGRDQGLTLILIWFLKVWFQFKENRIH